MCLCWNTDGNGKVTGMCDTEELARRIHDPNYKPELKKNISEVRRKMIQKNHPPLSEEAKSRAKRAWMEFFN